MTKIKVDKIEVGDEYYFTDTRFKYIDLFEVSTSKERINKIIGNTFSTKNAGWEYETQRFIGFTTKEEAKKYLIKKIKERKKQINKEYRKAIKKLEFND